MIIIVVIIIIHHPHRERERERERGTGDRTRRDKKTRSRKEKDLLLLWFMAAAALVVGGNATSGFTSISSAGCGGGSLASAILPWAVALVALLLLLEQLSYLRKKGPLPGPALVVPLLGSAVPMILDPTSYWRRLAAAASTRGLSADYLLGRFVVFLRSADLSHAVFANVRPDAFQVIGHPFGRKLFGDHNLIYMFGQQHKDLRRRIAPNFTPRALATYLHLQQSIVFSHIHRWIQISHSDDTSIPLRLLCRDMNLDTSQTVFAGPYLSPEARAAFNRDYNHFNVGLMALPVDLPGFAFRGARLAVSRLVSTLAGSVAESKRRMSSADAEPTCLVDFWMQETLREMAEAERAGAPPPPESGDREIGGHLFDFLFASQDASTSSLLWAVALLESHPEVLARVRAEVSSLWSPAEDDGRWPAITAEMLRGMRYTEAVAREVIRYRPPATLVPHVAAEEVELPGAGGYRVPKGAIVFPSLLEASFQGFSHPDRFDPDRFSDQRQEDRVHRKNFLAFGAGAHQCLGQRYALNHLILFIAAFVSLVDFKRHRTNGCDEIAYVPTIAPRDDCRVYLSPRTTRFPDF